MMNLNITLIKKFNFDVLALYLFFLWKISPGIFADGFNYDDSHEILISRADSVYDFFAFADHHFLYATLLYLLVFIIPFANLQIINLVFVLFILFFTKKLYEKLSFTYLSFVLSGLILLSSPIFLTYTLRIKQYTLDYLFALLIIYMFVKLEKSEILKQQFFYFGIVVSLFSLILAPVFIVLLTINLRENLKTLSIWIYIVLGILIYGFFEIGAITLKFFDEKYLDYFSFSFLTQGSIFDEMNNLYYSLLIFFRGISDNGSLFIYLLLFAIGLLKTFKTEKKLVVSFVLLFVLFCIFHVVDLYPISAGRNMTFIYPFVIIFLSQIIQITNNDKVSVIVFLLCTVLFSTFNKINYPNSYVSNLLHDSSSEELTIVDYYLIPQFTLYSDNSFTEIERRRSRFDQCLYSSNAENIIFLQDEYCNPLVLDLNKNKNYERYKKIVFISEENNINTKDEVTKVFKNTGFSIVSETKLGKSYKLVYEK